MFLKNSNKGLKMVVDGKGRGVTIKVQQKGHLCGDGGVLHLD